MNNSEKERMKRGHPQHLGRTDSWSDLGGGVVIITCMYCIIIIIIFTPFTQPALFKPRGPAQMWSTKTRSASSFNIMDGPSQRHF